MMIYRKKTLKLMCDFETTVDEDYANQTQTEVWASAICPIFDGVTEDMVYVDTSIDSCFDFYDGFLKDDVDLIIAYFHNLKFDGSFIIDYLLSLEAEPVIIKDNEKVRWAEEDELCPNQFCSCISAQGQWYSITYCNFDGKYIRFLDSSKLIPLPVSAIGPAFNTKHRKLEMEYIGERHAYGVITEEEEKYIKNDVLVVAEALVKMFEEGLNRITIGACAKSTFLQKFNKVDKARFFPNLAMQNVEYENGEKLDESADYYLRKAYKGGWCYVMPNKVNKVYKCGCTCDVNSLYPSMLLDNNYPIGKPIFFKGKVPDMIIRKPDMFYYFVRLKTRFYLKPNKLPMIQIKGRLDYDGNEWLSTSDIRNNDRKSKFYGQYSRQGRDLQGKIYQAIPELTLTKTDYEMLLDNYDLEDTEYIDGCYFGVIDGKTLFSDYVNHWANIKKTTKDKGKRQIAKMMLNSLTGKFGAKIDATTKLPYYDLNEERVKYSFVEDEKVGKAFYLPIVAANTAYARRFTITAAQANYDNFVYADTDSIHVTLKPEQVKGIKVHPTEFSCWKVETTWDEAIFARQKTYIEHVTEEDMEPIDKPYYNIKCAGMDKRPKELLNANLTGEDIECKNEYEIAFMKKKLTIEDFKIGLKVPGKLMTKTIKGGVLLVPGMYCMR